MRRCALRRRHAIGCRLDLAACKSQAACRTIGPAATLPARSIGGGEEGGEGGVAFRERLSPDHDLSSALDPGVRLELPVGCATRPQPELGRTAMPAEEPVDDQGLGEARLPGKEMASGGVDRPDLSTNRLVRFRYPRRVCIRQSHGFGTATKAPDNDPEGHDPESTAGEKHEQCRTEQLDPLRPTERQKLRSESANGPEPSP